MGWCVKRGAGEGGWGRGKVARCAIQGHVRTGVLPCRGCVLWALSSSTRPGGRSRCPGGAHRRPGTGYRRRERATRRGAPHAGYNAVIKATVDGYARELSAGAVGSRDMKAGTFEAYTGQQLVPLPPSSPPPPLAVHRPAALRANTAAGREAGQAVGCSSGQRTHPPAPAGAHRRRRRQADPPRGRCGWCVCVSRHS